MQLTFGGPEEVTSPSDDSRSFLFPFKMVATSMLGLPDEAHATSEHRLIVEISGSRLASWNLSDPDLEKVLFEIGRRVVSKKIVEGEQVRKVLAFVSTESHSGMCPFDPERIPNPKDCVIEVEVERRIGF